MHACIAGAHAYDRYKHMTSTSDGKCTPRRTLEECYHISQSSVLLNKHLNSLFSTGEVRATPDVESEPSRKARGSRDSRDSVWGTASLLCLATFSSSSSSRDACTPEDSWPLRGILRPVCSSSSHNTTKTSSHTTSETRTLASSPENNQGETPGQPPHEEGFNWSAMTTSKLSLWSFVQPLREDSIFHLVAPTFADMNYKLPESGVNGIPPELSQVCGLTEVSNADTSPYFLAAHAVAHLYHANGDSIKPFSSTDNTPSPPNLHRQSENAGEKTLLLKNKAINTPRSHNQTQKELPKQHCVKVGSTKVFTRIVTGQFESLLRDRDPVALLLLYLWYSKARQGIWWIELRARVEVPAICLYLRRYHSERRDIMVFLTDF